MATVSEATTKFLDYTKDLSAQERDEAACRIVNERNTAAEIKLTSDLQREISNQTTLKYQIKDVERKSNVELNKFKSTQITRRAEIQAELEMLDLEVEQKKDVISDSYSSTLIRLESQLKISTNAQATIQQKITKASHLDCCGGDCSCAH